MTTGDVQVFRSCFAQLFIFTAVLFSIRGYGADRGLVQGVVCDAESGAPLPYTNVFLANTTLGDATDNEGKFHIESAPAGAYQLVASRIGYRSYVKDVVILPQIPTTLKILLEVAPVEGSEISVEARVDHEWRRLLREFLTQFLGETPNARQCRLLNPEVLSLRKDPKTEIMAAATDSLLVVENHSLGYRLDIVLQEFQWGEQRGKYIIYPRYSPLSSEDQRLRIRTRQLRRQTFERSMRGFWAAAAHRKIKERYILHQIFETAQPTDLSRQGRSIFLDSLAITLADSSRLLYHLDFNDVLQVYDINTGGASTIKCVYGFVDFDERGNYYPADALQISGYWAQFRVADTLPFDYEPED
jgi:hypothetical protein